ncbi:MAG: alpha/beta fold hydrolase [Candidatus Dormibacteria bacterium]
MPRLKTNGVELYYERSGEGEPLLLVHGLLFSGDSWREQVSALAQDYNCITVDLRGQHRSETTPDLTGYDLWNQVEDVHGLIEQLGVAPVHYVGLSMGGMIGMRLALRHPGDLRDMVLLDTAADGEEPEKAERYAAMRHVMRKGELDAVLPALPPVFFSDDYVAQRGDLVEGWFDSLRQGNADGFALASQAVDERDDITEQLGTITAPTLVLHGTEDVPIPVEKGEAIAAAIPGARLELIAGAGHQSNMDHPTEVTSLLREWLASRAGAGVR